MIKILRLKQKTLRPAALVIFIIVGCFAVTAFGRTTYSVPCRKFPEGVSRQQIEENFEKYRRGEISSFPTGQLTCEAALPILKKYALDSNPKIREIVTSALATAYYDLHRSFYPQAFKLLLLQIETFPYDKSLYPTTYAANFPCYRFDRIDRRRLTEALIARIKYVDENRRRDEIYLLKREEIYMLGCLSKREQKAKDFLLEMRRDDYQTSLNEDYRQYQKKLIIYALVEAGLKEAEEKVLADIEAAISTGDADKLPSSGGFTSCRILMRYISFIKDRRELIVDEYQNGEIKHLKGRVGDGIINQFTSIYGWEGTGETDVAFRARSDAEIETVYKRVKSYIKRKVNKSCSFEE